MDGLNGNLIKITNMQISLVGNCLCYTIATKSNWLVAPVLLGVNHSLSRRLSSCFTKVEINATCVWPPGLGPRAQLARMDRWEARTGVELVVVGKLCTRTFPIAD